METPKQIAETIIQLMKQQGLLENLPEVVDELQAYVQSQQSSVIVESATDLEPETMDQIVELLKKKLGYSPNIEHRINKDLIAGIRIKINDQLIDATVKAQLESVFEKIH